MSERLLDRITKAAQIHGLLDEKKEADFLREVRAKIVSLEVENKAIAEKAMAHLGCHLIDNHESKFDGGENEIQQICVSALNSFKQRN